VTPYRAIAVTAQLDGSARSPSSPASVINHSAGQCANVRQRRTGRAPSIDYRSQRNRRASPLQNLTYTYDASNNVTSIADGVTSANSQSFATTSAADQRGGGYGSLGYTWRRRRQTCSPELPHRRPLMQGVRSNRPCERRRRESKGRPHRSGNIDNFNRAWAGGQLGLQPGRTPRLGFGGRDFSALYTYDAFDSVVKVGVTATTLPVRP
jgi:hypothetical protein